MKRKTKPKRVPRPRLSPPNRDTARIHARRHLKGACEHCGSEEALQAHHLDGNWRNNSADNIETICKDCHSKHHSSRRRAKWEYTSPDGVRVGTVQELPITLTPLPRKTAKELAYAAAWCARRFLKEIVSEGSGGAYPMPHGRLDWYSMKRRFAISTDDNDRLAKAYLAACDRLELVPYGSETWRLLRDRPLAARMPSQANEWFPAHHGRIEELLKMAEDEEERCKRAATKRTGRHGAGKGKPPKNARTKRQARKG